MNNFVETLLTKLGLADGEERQSISPIRYGTPAPCKETILTRDQSYFKDSMKDISVLETSFLNHCEKIDYPKLSARMDPKGIVIHFTGSYNAEDTIKWFEETSSSCHLILDKVGRFHQMVPFNRAAEHSGDSHWAGYSWLDNFFIGIEVVCLGPLIKKDDKFFDCYGRQYLGAVVEKKLLGYRYWEPFTKYQMDRLVQVCSVLMSKYKFSANMICGHHETSPDRRLDPGGSLIISMKEFRTAVTANNWEMARETFSLQR